MDAASLAEGDLLGVTVEARKLRCRFAGCDALRRLLET